MASIKVLLALLGAVAVVRGQFPQFPQFPQPQSCRPLGPTEAQFQCNELSVYRYSNYSLPNSVGIRDPNTAMQSAMAYSSLFNNTQCDASAEELQQFICITFFPPCVQYPDGRLHPVNPVPPCQSWCEDLEMRCGGALTNGFNQIPWVPCANIYQGRQRQCWRYISGDSSSIDSSPSSSISSPSSPSSASSPSLSHGSNSMDSNEAGMGITGANGLADMPGGLANLLNQPLVDGDSAEKLGIMAMMLSGNSLPVWGLNMVDSSEEFVQVLQLNAAQTAADGGVLTQGLSAGANYFLLGYDFDKANAQASPN